MGNSSTRSMPTGITQDDFKNIIYGNIIYTYASQKDKKVTFKNAEDIDIITSNDSFILPIFEENYYSQNKDVIDNYVENNILSSYEKLSKFMKFIKCNVKTVDYMDCITEKSILAAAKVNAGAGVNAEVNVNAFYNKSSVPHKMKIPGNTNLDDEMIIPTQKNFCPSSQIIKKTKKKKTPADKINERINELSISISEERASDTLSDVTKAGEYDQESI